MDKDKLQVSLAMKTLTESRLSLASLSLSCAFDDLPNSVFVIAESAFEGPALSSAGVHTSLPVASSRSDIALIQFPR